MNFFSNIVLLIIFLSPLCAAQSIPKKDSTKIKHSEALPLINVNGDTLPQKAIREVTIYQKPAFKSRRQRRRYNRLIYNVKKVYPYAIYTRNKLQEIQQHIQYLDTEKEQNKYIRQVQKEMMDQFEGDIRNMTFSQGKILIKLIDRETGNTSYSWLKDLKGDFFAGFWQTVARIFGSNLKAEYDPRGDDILIEQIIRLIDSGLI